MKKYICISLFFLFTIFSAFSQDVLQIEYYTVSDTTPGVGDVVTFSTRIRNVSAATVTTVSLNLVIPNGYSAPSRISWTGLTINAGATITRNCTATVVAYSAGISYYSTSTASIAGETILTNNTGSAVTQQPFSTSSTQLFLSKSPTGIASTLQNVAYNANPFVYSDIGTNAHGLRYTTIGFNPIDGFIYGVRVSSNVNYLDRIDAAGYAFNLGAISNFAFTGTFTSGGMDNSGNLYVQTNGAVTKTRRISKIVVSTNTNLGDKSPSMTNNDTIKMGDIAFNPVNSLLYTVAEDVNGKYKGQLLSTNYEDVTPVFTKIGSPSGIGEPYEFGALFSDSNGHIYGIDDVGSGFYQFDLTTGNKTKIADSAPNTDSDGAFNSSVALNFSTDIGVTNTSNLSSIMRGGSVIYTVVVENLGAFGVSGEGVVVNLPSGITASDFSYSAVVENGATTRVVGTQTGAISDIVNLPITGKVTYTITISVPVSYIPTSLAVTATINKPTNITDTNAGNNTATATVTIIDDFDEDAITDALDLDVDNDGIWNVDEGAQICAGATAVKLNTVPYTLNAMQNTSTTHTPVVVSNLVSKTMNFSAALNGTAIWSNGVQLQEIGGTQYIFVQPNTTSGGANNATYTFTFPTSVTGLSFLATGLNVNDAFEVYAYDASNNPIALTTSNLSDFVPDATEYTNSVVGNAVKIVGIATDGAARIDTKSVKISITGTVSKVEIIAYKNDGVLSNVTAGFKIFEYCTSNSNLDSDGDGIPDYFDLNSDGDGCFDAVEGDEHVINSNLNVNGSINTTSTGGIDADGVPNIVNNGGTADIGGDRGQLIGISRNASLNSCLNYWVGSASNVWTNTSNWAAQEVPSPGQNIEFATTANNSGTASANNLIVTAASEKIIGNLTNLSSRALVVSAGTSVKVQGVVTGSETNTDRIVIQAASDGTTPNGSFVVSCANNTGNTIQATVQLYAKGFKGTQQSWTDNIAGSPTFGQSFSSSYKWQYFGVSVTSIVAFPTFVGGFLREYVETKNASASYYNKWNDLTNLSTLTAFKGYSVTQDDPTTYEIKGSLKFCDQEITLTRNAPVVTGSTDPQIYNSRYGLGQNIIGNSFTAAIPISSINFTDIKVDGVATTNDGSLLEKTVYLYNTGSFVNWTGGNTSNSATTAGSYLAVPSNIGGAIYDQIPSMQGFLLRHTGALATVITMTLPYDSLLQNTEIQTAPRKPLSFIKLELNSKSTKDNLWLFEVDNTSDKFDNGWDGRKYFGTPTAFIYSTTTDGNMQVNTTDNLLGSSIVFVPNKDVEYTLLVKKSNLNESYDKLYLIDLVDKKSILIDGDEVKYTFQANNAGTPELRFVLSKSPDGIVSTNKGGMSAYLADNKLHAINRTDQQSSLEIYNISGQLLYSKNVKALSLFNDNISLTKGAYIISMKADNQSFSQKMIVY